MKKYFTLLGITLISGIVFSQIGININTPQATLDVVGKAIDNTSLDGIIAPRMTGNQLRAKAYTTAQTGAMVYVITPDSAPAGQTADVTAVGYYYFNGTKWVTTGSPTDTNIYNASGSLTGARTLTNNGFSLNFIGANQSTAFSSAGGIRQTGTAGSKRADIILTANDNNGDSVSSNLQIWQDPENSGQIIVGNDSRGLTIGTRTTTQSAPIKFETSAGGGANGIEKMRITGEGNVGVATTSPTEKFDNNGITRLRILPLNGSTNAINTTATGTASASQNQTFTATKTVVADANGVLGTVAGVPSDAGSSKVLVIANAPGTQNIGGQFTPNAAIGQFTNKSLDVYNAFTGNVFTVPANMGGIYIIVMQNSNNHVSTGSATPTWHTAAYYEKSTDDGASWSTMIKHTYADLAGTIVDNGNTLYWTGFLNEGDKIRVRFSCNATTNNIVNYGGLSITKLVQ